MPAKEPHKHDYTKIGYIREVGTTAPTEMLRVDLSPRTIDRIILIRSCACGASQAFDCGDKQPMREKYTELTRVKS